MDEIKARVAPTTKVASPRLKAYVNHGRWVADCPCGGGIACGPDSPDAVCYDCRTERNISFPSASRIATATELLSARPLKHQNWRPDQGESVTELRAENAAAEILGVAAFTGIPLPSSPPV
jgi:hypothetical protein